MRGARGLDAQRPPDPHLRLLSLEETVRNRKNKLTDEQIQALERFDPEYRERHIEVGATGELVAVDTFSRAR